MTARMIVILAALIGGLYAFDTFLARVERSEIGQEAERRFHSGLDLYLRKQPAKAAEEFRRAWSLERSNSRYQLELAAAELEAGDLDDAHTLLDDALRRDPNSGRANLLQARLLKYQRRPLESDSYYHRAIYGGWPGDGGNRRIQTRLELIRELDERGDRKQMLAELLPLEADTLNFETRKQVASFFTAAGATDRAAAVYKDLLTQHPGDADLLAGLGDAQLAAGQYAAALSSFQHAYRIAPARTQTQLDMQLAAGLVAIDPTPRRLPSREKFDRSNTILKMVGEACAANQDQLKQSGDMLTARADRTNEAAEQRLQLAEQLWRNCPSTQSRLLPLLMRKLSTEPTL